MSAQILSFDRAARCHASLGHDALMRKVRLVAKGNGCNAAQIVDVEATAEFWLKQGASHDEIVKRARARAQLLTTPTGPEAA